MKMTKYNDTCFAGISELFDTRPVLQRRIQECEDGWKAGRNREKLDSRGLEGSWVREEWRSARQRRDTSTEQVR